MLLLCPTSMTCYYDFFLCAASSFVLYIGLMKNDSGYFYINNKSINVNKYLQNFFINWLYYYLYLCLFEIKLLDSIELVEI